MCVWCSVVSGGFGGLGRFKAWESGVGGNAAMHPARLACCKASRCAGMRTGLCLSASAYRAYTKSSDFFLGCSEEWIVQNRPVEVYDEPETRSPSAVLTLSICLQGMLLQ